MNDKLKCHTIFSKHNINNVPVLATINNGILQYSKNHGSEDLAQDLVIKPNVGSQGGGVKLFPHASHRSTNSLEQDLVKSTKESFYLVQPRITNHQQLNTLSNGHLATIRIMTANTPNDGIAYIRAFFKMPVGNMIIDNYSEGGLACPIFKDGFLGSAMNKTTPLVRFDYHPDTKGRITGHQIPQFNEAIELAKNAHKLLSTHRFLGWDIAITPSGPTILEANANLVCDLIQAAFDAPLSETEFSDICLQWIKN